MNHGDGSPSSSMITGNCCLSPHRWPSWYFGASDLLKPGYLWMVATKMQELFELTLHLRNSFALLAQKVGFVDQNDRSPLYVELRVKLGRKDRLLACSLIWKQHIPQKDSPVRWLFLSVTYKANWSWMIVCFPCLLQNLSKSQTSVQFMKTELKNKRVAPL